MGKTFQLVTNLNFWQQAWEEMQANTIHGQKCWDQDGGRMRAYWDARAEKFAEATVEGKQANHRLVMVVNWLEQEGVLNTETRVLDVGCGPGGLSLPLARKVASVTAFDPAPEMIKMLGKKAKASGVQNIITDCAAWEEIDLKEKGWEKNFNLVIASQCPGIHNLETLLKMNQASRGYCFLSAFAGHWVNPAEEALWPLIVGEKELPCGEGFIYILNVLYVLGFRPSMRFTKNNRVKEDKIEEAIQELCLSFNQYVNLTGEKEKIIRDYVETHSVNGVYKEESERTIGMLLWKVE